MMVRFATLCDRCKARSDEYTSWPHCRECGEDRCPGCYVPGTLREDDGRNTVLCEPCAEHNE
jgi:hypothetical protein